MLLINSLILCLTPTSLKMCVTIVSHAHQPVGDELPHTIYSHWIIKYPTPMLTKVVMNPDNWKE